jgi:hypothetical protein
MGQVIEGCIACTKPWVQNTEVHSIIGKSHVDRWFTVIM